MKPDLNALALPLPRVSVIVPCHNHARFVSEALQSVAAQTLSSLETIVIDDGSSDDSAAVLMPWRQRGVHVVHQAQQGVAAARNQGIKLARGEFVAFLDADDLWPCTDMLASAVALLDQRRDIGWTYGDAQPFKDEDHRRQFCGDPYLQSAGRYTETSEKALQTELSVHDLCNDERFFIPTGTLLIRKSCLDAVGGFDEQLHMFEDVDLWLRLLTYPVAFYPRVLLWRRVHGNNISHRRWAHLDDLRILFQRHRLAERGIPFGVHAARAHYGAAKEAWRQRDFALAARRLGESLSEQPAWKPGLMFLAASLAARCQSSLRHEV